jgi:hypothetical protein
MRVSDVVAEQTTSPAWPARRIKRETAVCKVQVERPVARPATTPRAGIHPMSLQTPATACPMTSPITPPVNVANTLVTMVATATPRARACGITSVVNSWARRPAAVAGSGDLGVVCGGRVSVAGASGQKARKRRSRTVAEAKIADVRASRSRVTATIHHRTSATMSAVRCSGWR